MEQEGLCDDALELENLVSQMKELMVEHVNYSRKPDALVLDYKSPEELKKIMDLELGYEGVGVVGLMPIIQNILKYSVNTWHPGFLGKLYASTNPIGIISEMLISLLNGNAHVYHVSPAMTMIENTVSHNLATLLGMGEESGGITCPGGSFSNQLAMITARTCMFPEIKTKGYHAFGKKLVVFTSVAGHYSVEKTAMTLGLGIDSVIKVPCDDQGRMRTDELERLIKKSIQQGEIPFFINATAGTTGSFDPLNEIGKIAKRYNLWFHIDGSWGGSLVFSDKHRHMIDGASLADTFVLNPHKMLGTPLQCSFLLARDKKIFLQSNSLKAEYLFRHEDDLGDGTVGCGRRPDAIKLFIGWKIYGIQGYQMRIEHAFKMTKYLTLIVKNNQRFKLVLDEPPSLQVCFWYLPIGIDFNLENKKFKKMMSMITKEMYRRIMHHGKFLLDYSPIILGEKELPCFFRIALNAPSICEKHLEGLVSEIEKMGEDILEWFEEYGDENNDEMRNGVNGN
ncbi:28583_t:CDS:2 [Dentiscutata erythropus]|uniref:28583_t:CDS:1 n=1 Tax=Dentiscutata erythropus TaxID=1348616 RepID=A0A9N9EQY3_9GLOM|nr:28583_t:CDS:2 [Dentiscutata erythropus]